MQIEIKNIKQIIRAFQESPAIMAKELQNAIKKTGGFVLGETKKHISSGTQMWKAPVDTGAMRRLIHIAHSGKLETTIKTSDMTNYAVYVHEGTRKMRARPFFEITAKLSEKEANKFFLEALSRTAKEISKRSR